MFSKLARYIAAFSTCAALAGPVAAQSFTGNETHYAAVRGWDVLSFTESNGAFNSCGAVKSENGNRVMIAQGVDGTWNIAVPTRQSGSFGGGILDIDKASIDSQFGFIGGFAYRELSNRELQMIKAGNHLGVLINGDGAERWWSLSGSTAAILKATECVQRRGRAAAAPVTPSPRAPLASPLLAPTVPVGETRVGNCEMGFVGGYRCTFEGLPAKQGYRSSTRVVDVSNTAPTLDLDAISTTEADVWAYMNGNWLFMGRWAADNRSGNCLAPGAIQSPDARNNLGQDAWMLCLQ